LIARKISKSDHQSQGTVETVPAPPSLVVATRTELRVDPDEVRDSWEGGFWDVDRPYPADARLRLSYTDANGSFSERTVEVSQFGEFESGILLIGHCRLRNATRTFRVDRIQACVDEETGEIVEDVAQYLRGRYEASPDSSLRRLLESDYDTLRILLYVGKADGRLMAAERIVIRDTCVAISKDARITDEIISELFARMEVPSVQAFKLAVGRMSKRDSPIRQMLLAAAEKMVATQKKVHQSEQEALDYMRTRFQLPGESVPGAS
jgi:hypothetical protein